MKTERTTEQDLKRCAMLKSYAERAYAMANMRLAGLYDGMDDKTPMQVVKEVREMWPDYNKQIGLLFAQRDKEVADFDDDCNRENLRRADKTGAASVRDCTEAMRRFAEAMQGLSGGTEIRIPQPVGQLKCDYVQASIAVFEPIGWFKRLMLRWCFGLRYESGDVNEQED